MSAQGAAKSPPPAEPRGPLLRLLVRARRGDGRAREALQEHLVPTFQAWAVARCGAVTTIPKVRAFVDGALTRIVHDPQMKYLRDGTLLVDLRQDLNGRIQPLVSLESTVVPREIAVYERGLLSLTDIEREAAVLHLEMQRDFGRLAVDLDVQSSEDARGLFRQALLQLAREMSHDL